MTGLVEVDPVIIVRLGRNGGSSIIFAIFSTEIIF
jgi:hypothetical protein